jgi:hypothetical protein
MSHLSQDIWRTSGVNMEGRLKTAGIHHPSVKTLVRLLSVHSVNLYLENFSYTHNTLKQWGKMPTNLGMLK